MDKIEEKLKKNKLFWENNILNKMLFESSFWRAVALSYIEKDYDLEEQKVFVTQISFYPQLIKTLIEVLNTNIKERSGASINLDITFFSTLLPRHYWNFPLEYKDDNNIHIDASDFLDTYRTSIEESINSDNERVSVKISRVLVVKSGDKRDIDGTSILFSEADLANDEKCLLPNIEEGKMDWLTYINKDKTFINRHLIDIKDLIKTEDLYKKKKNESSRIYLLRIIDDAQIEKDTETVYNYYITKLHSKGGAKKIIICPDNSPDSVFKKKSGYCRERELRSFSPNLSLIKITVTDSNGQVSEFEYILDAYMDLNLSIVKLQIWNANDKPKLAKKIHEIRDNIAVEIRPKNKRKGTNRKNETPNALRNKVTTILDAIESFKNRLDNDKYTDFIGTVYEKISTSRSKVYLNKVCTIAYKKEITIMLLEEIDQLPYDTI